MTVPDLAASPAARGENALRRSPAHLAKAHAWLLTQLVVAPRAGAIVWSERLLIYGLDASSGNDGGVRERGTRRISRSSSTPELATATEKTSLRYGSCSRTVCVKHLRSRHRSSGGPTRTIPVFVGAS